MKIVIQRVRYAAVKIDDKVYGTIDKGFVLLIGFTHSDNKETCEKLANKVSGLRIFEDEAGKLNKCLADIDGSILSISQFTLYADCKKGRRPGFELAMKPDQATILYDHFNDCLRNLDQKVVTGVFQADMKIELVNDGPVTIILDSAEL
ncbi:MAG: D-aminoacyl-tRNA deacylase [Erysipelotrichaceae bacterium]|nr:D-aminoacyl-tRNA deacylase [Erysipelotrichaceae bacterium]